MATRPSQSRMRPRKARQALLSWALTYLVCGVLGRHLPSSLSSRAVTTVGFVGADHDGVDRWNRVVEL